MEDHGGNSTQRADRRFCWRLGDCTSFPHHHQQQFSHIVYPFLPVISRGLGVPLTAASFLLTLRALAGLSSPLFGPLSDRYGRRLLMLAGLGMLTTAGALIAGWPTYAVAIIAFVLIGLSKTAYDPAMQAYLSDAVPYHRRGRVLGITEMAWSAAWLIGVPAAGFLIERAGWRSPFVALTLLALVGLLFTWLLPPDQPQRASPTAPRWAGPFVSLTTGLRHNRSAWLGMAVGLLFMFVIENVFVVYGAWMEETFSLSVGPIGPGASPTFDCRIGLPRVPDQTGLYRTRVWPTLRRSPPVA